MVGKGDDKQQDDKGIPEVGARRLDQAYTFLPDTWSWVPAVSDADHAVAERLCDGEEIRAALVQRLRVARPSLQVERHAGVAIWVPRRDRPEIQGVLQIVGLEPDEGDEVGECSREYPRSLIEPDRRTWCTVYSRTLEEVDLPAGPTLVVREVTKVNESPDSEQEPLTDNTVYDIFPPGSRDQLEMKFWTAALNLGDELAAEAAWIADTVEITLGEPA